MRVSPTSAFLREGLTLRLAATVTDPVGGELEGLVPRWSTSNDGVAVVSDSGVVQGVREGRATIEARVGDASGSALITVTPGRTGGAGDLERALPSNEPAGYAAIARRDFRDREGAGWGLNPSRLFTVEQDATTPGACCSVGRAHYPEGFVGGRSPVTTWTSFEGEGFTELYVSFWLKLSDNWQQHSSGISKIAFAWIHDDPAVYLAAVGGGRALRPEIRLQNVPRGRNLLPNVGSVPVERGRWHHWEVQLVANRSSTPDGIARLWIDGTLVSDHRDVLFAGPGQARTWQHLYWSPVWGGRGDVVRSGMSMYIDRLYASGRE